MNPQDTLFVLVHDAWHAGWAWQAVIEWLEERDWSAVALDLPGHTPAASQVESLTLEDYSQAVVGFVREQQATHAGRSIVLVGHGTGGVVVQTAAQELGDALKGLIFAGAYVLNDGETIAAQMPPEMADFFQSLADSRPDHRIDLTTVGDFWRFNVINDDPRRADELLARLVPEPIGPFFEKTALPTFARRHPPAAYISFNDDLSLPPGEFYPRMANKLGPHRHMTVNAGHEGILTKPREVAEALIFLASHGLEGK